MGNAASGGPRARVVVVGAGYAGLVVAEQLQASADVTVLDPRESFHHILGSTRCLAREGFEHSIFIPRDRVLHACKRVVGTATRVDAAAKVVHYQPAATAVTASPEGGAPATDASLPYDILVVATGMSYSSPGCDVDGSTAANKQAYRDIRAAIAAATSIVVVGGGAVGAEIAGEIAGGYSGKTVTVVHSGAHLVSGKENGAAASEPAIGAAVESRLKAMGVEVLLGDRVVTARPESAAAAAAAGLRHVTDHAFAGAAKIVTQKGRTLPCDLQIWAAGGARGRTAFLAASGLGAALTPSGEVKVDAFSRVEGHADIFAAGDVAASGHPKMALVIEKSTAHTVAANVLALARAVSEGKAPATAEAALRPLSPWNSAAIIVVLSPSVGFGKFGPAWLPDAIVSLTKGRDKLAGRQHSRMRYAVAELQREEFPQV